MDLIWSMKNGLMMNSDLKKQFDKGAFNLLPTPMKPKEPTRWKFVLLDQAPPQDIWILSSHLETTGRT